MECKNCNADIESGWKFCPVCGLPTGQVIWFLSSSKNGEPAERLTLTPGGTFFLIAKLTSGSPITAKVDLTSSRGVNFIGKHSERTVDLNRPAIFEFNCPIDGQSLAGNIKLLLKNGIRNRQEWWLKETWSIPEIFKISNRIIIRENRWEIGNPVVLFLPDILEQSCFLWNNSEAERDLIADSPDNFKVSHFTIPIERTNVQVNSDELAPLSIRVIQGQISANNLYEWNIPDNPETIKLLKMPRVEEDNSVDLVIAIDYGTRNCGIRARWRKDFPKYNKTKDQIDIIGTERFPSSMVLHKREQVFYWGEEAATKIEQHLRADKNLIAVENLKTDLRNNINQYITNKPLWTNKELIGRFFEKIFRRLIDNYLSDLSNANEITRESFKIEYIITRPVLDENEGGEIKENYVSNIRDALVEKVGLKADDIKFVIESEAAARWIAYNFKEEMQRIGHGSLIAVIDAGGGTTDITLARINIHDGNVKLDLCGSDRLSADLSEYGITDNEIGGNTIDQLLAYKLRDSASELIEFSRNVNFNNLWDFINAEEFKNINHQFATARTLKEKFYMENLIKLSKFFEEDRFRDNTTLSYDKYYENLLTPLMKDPLDSMSDRINTGHEYFHTIEKVFFVGGSNIDKFVRNCYFDQNIIPSDTEYIIDTENEIHERLNSVVNGASLSGERFYNLSQISLTLQLPNEHELKIIGQGDTLPEITKIHHPGVGNILEPEEKCTISLYAESTLFTGKHEIARAWHHNRSENSINYTFSITINKSECKAVFTDNADNREYLMWYIKLNGGQK